MGNRHFDLAASQPDTHRHSFDRSFDILSYKLGSMLISTHNRSHNARPIDREVVLFANFVTQLWQELAGHLGRLTVLAFAVDIVSFGTFKNEAENDDALSIADAAHLKLAWLQIFRRVHRLPDVMLTFAPIVITALQTCKAFQHYGSKSPHRLLRSAHSEVATGNKLAGDWTDLHR